MCQGYFIPFIGWMIDLFNFILVFWGRIEVEDEGQESLRTPSENKQSFYGNVILLSEDRKKQNETA